MGMVEVVWMVLATAHMQFSRWAKATGAGTNRLIGQSTVEYALVGALVVIAAAGAMSLLGTEITSVFNKITTTLSGGH